MSIGKLRYREGFHAGPPKPLRAHNPKAPMIARHTADEELKKRFLERCKQLNKDYHADQVGQEPHIL